jgi:prepilin-type N-terminal cleavage/methylation domain-containing protein
MECSSMARRSGFTLFELLAVLIIITLAFAFVAPSFVSRPGPSSNEPQSMIDDALRVAVRTGKAVTIPVAPDSTLVVHLSPLGACTLERKTGSDNSSVIDPVTCRLSAR